MWPPQVVLDTDTEVLELEDIPGDVEPASIEPCEPSRETPSIEDLLKTMGAGGEVDLWATAPDVDLVWRLAVRTAEELSDDLRIPEATTEVLGMAARAQTGSVPTVIDKIVATTGASKQAVLDRFMTEAGPEVSSPEIRAALLKRFGVTA